jgi:hypothetical protein
MSNILDDIPPEFICPITHLLMEYPFITGAGNSYEYSALAHWLQKKNRDPVTGGVLADKTIVPNNSLRSSIQSWLASNPNIGREMRNPHAEKPPTEAYIPAGDRTTVTALKETPLDRVLRVEKCFELGKNEKKNQRLLQEQRLRTITSSGHTYTWHSEGKHVRCDNQPTWVEAPEPDMFVTPRGIVFFDCRDLRDVRVFPGTDLVDSCQYCANCTNHDCGYAHPFVCRWGVSCRNQENGRCKFFHPSADSVTPLGTSYPQNQECKYGVNCSNLTCMFAHPLGRMAVQRQATRMFITHSLDLQDLATPIDLQLEWPESCTSFQFQGEFVFAFEPYPGTWAKEHFRSVTVLRFDAETCRYRKIANYALEGHYCNCAVAAGRYLVLSFWPYEEEAMRTVWECLRMGRTMEKTLKNNAAEIASLQTQLQEKEEELNAVKSELLSTKGEVEKLRQEVYKLRGSLFQAQQSLANKNQQISRMAASGHQKDLVHARQVQNLRSKMSQARSEARVERDKYRAMQNRYEQQRLERLRLRDPIHVYALREGRAGFEREDWAMVLDYHKGAHDLSISAPRVDGNQMLEVVEHSKVVQFELCVPRNVADIGAALPLQPGRLCDDF